MSTYKIKKVFFYFVSVAHFFHAVAVELEQFRKQRNTYFITRSMLAKQQKAYNFYGDSIRFNNFKSSYLNVSKIEHKKNNFEIRCNFNPNYTADKEAVEHVIHTYLLDGKRYSNDDAYGSSTKIVINVTSDCIQLYLNQYGSKQYNLAALRECNKKIRDLLPQASQDQEIEAVLRCLAIRCKRWDDPENLKLIVYQQEFDTIVESYKQKYYYRNVCIACFLMVLLCYFIDVNHTYSLVKALACECALLFFIKNQYGDYKTLLFEYEEVKNSEVWQQNASTQKYNLEFLLM